MFRTLLIANRGEIARRVTRTARRLGVRTVAVYSEADAGALHVSEADTAVLLGPPEARASYLDVSKVIAAARESGAEAVHPGYGFLAENADFAEACAAAGLVFVGPPAAAIRAMGDKRGAKALMAEAGVPVIPGYAGVEQTPDALRTEAERIGFPLLIKAVAGGGGRGIRQVADPLHLPDALASARREALAAFGDDRVLLEAFLERARHVEVQVLADTHGHVVHLFERDCSVQRRHQKVMEEAPAPGLAGELRTLMSAAAVSAASAVGYTGAGTVEFLLDPDGRFHFMEMNTRLQVEHPVTEMITGLDLVEWQLRVAAGEALPWRQDELSMQGHAIEARLYAEDPEHGFRPSVGRLLHLDLPQPSSHLRVETGVVEGDEISHHYDPMIAKIIAWDETRPRCLARLRDALAASRVAGVSTNLGLLAAIAARPAFARGAVDTGFVERRLKELAPKPAPPSDQALALACLALVLDTRERAHRDAARSADPCSPWHRRDGWMLNDERHAWVTLGAGGRDYPLRVRYSEDGLAVDAPGAVIRVDGRRGPRGRLDARVDGAPVEAVAVRRERAIELIHAGRTHVLELPDAADHGAHADGPASSLRAPMPGRIAAVLVGEGDAVEAGRPLLVLEAMKMEHLITAPGDGVVGRVNYPPGAEVEEGAVLLSIEAGE